MDRPFHVLVLSNGNSARSIFAEALFNQLGRGRIRAWSASSTPAGRVNPYALDLLHRMGFQVAGLRSKSWDVFAQADAPELDFIISICDSASGEPCPVWPGRSVVTHWSIPDPAAITGNANARRRAFARAFYLLKFRVSLFTSLRTDSLMHLMNRRAEAVL